MTTLSLLLCAALVTQSSEASASAVWRDLLAAANRNKLPIVVFFRTQDCVRCEELERIFAHHPAIERRLPAVAFATLALDESEAAALWKSSDPGIAFFDRSGALRARWPIVPDTTNFGIILDSVIAVAPQFEHALQLFESGHLGDGEIALALGFARLNRNADARAALERAREKGSPEIRQSVMVTSAVLDFREGRSANALTQLQIVAANAVTPKIAAEASKAIANIREAMERNDPARHSGVIRILPPDPQVVSGRRVVKTHVTSTDVARVTFSLDGREAHRSGKPPFSATLDFGAIPERHSIRVVAFNRKGQEIGRDERVVNEAGETFWLRILEPREGTVHGRVPVRMDVRAPAAGRIRRVTLSWNDAELGVLTAAPWTSIVSIPEEQVGVLRALAELDDGRTSEDAVLLNARGMVEQSNVQLVEIPITVLSRDGTAAVPTADRIIVREGSRIRAVESLSTAAETPLTIGLLVDVSDSMQKMLPDVQEAAIRFLETTLGDRDRAFIVTFDTRAHLVQAPTSDKALLLRQIMKIRPDGLTAIHDAIALGLLQFEGVKGRRAMVVFSDGLDRTSRYQADEVRELAKRLNVPIHAILTGEPEVDELHELATSVGGTAHILEDLATLPAVYARIEAALRTQILAFIRTDPATRENEWRAISVEVGGFVVHAPQGYYATW